MGTGIHYDDYAYDAVTITRRPGESPLQFRNRTMVLFELKA
jgi:hypothetical protein